MPRTSLWLPAICLSLGILPVLGAAPPVPPTPPAAPPAPGVNPDDEKLLKAAKVGVDGPDLLEFFRKHTMPTAQQDRILGLIQQLGDDSFKVRQKASGELTTLGAVALPLLRRALDDPDEEVKERARDLLTAGTGVEERAALSAAAVRALRVKAPADAAAVLLAYLPAAETDAVEEEVLTSLAVLGVHDGKVDAPVVAALKDKVGCRRAAAALVLGRSGTADQRSDASGLLADPDPRVRFRVAQGLLAGRDRAGLAVLVNLVKEGAPDLALRADDLLFCAAGARAPRYAFAEDVQSRRSCYAAWASWFQVYGKTVDLTRADIDLPAFNNTIRSCEVVRQFFTTLVSGDLAAFKKTADAPFSFPNQPLYAKTDDLDRFFNDNVLQLRGSVQAAFILRMLPVDEFVRTNATPDEKQFAAKFRKQDVFVFQVQMAQMGMPLPVAVPGNPGLDITQGTLVLVRLTGDQPRVIAASPRNGLPRW